MADDHPRVEVASCVERRASLQRNHTRTTGIWLVTWKGAAGARHVPCSDVVDDALCFGWIDSLPRKRDADRTMVRLSPRKPASALSDVSKTKIESLLAEGRMTKAGLAAIDRAKADGSWSLLEPIATLSPPPDLAKALAGNPAARMNFNAFPHRYAAQSSNGSRKRSHLKRARAASRRQQGWQPTPSAPITRAS
jgi:hypothetical protein